MKIDKDLIKQLSESLNEFHLTELEYSDGKTTIKVGKGSKAITTTSPTTESSVKTQAQKEDTSSNIVRSPMVGTAYLSPEPGAKPGSSCIRWKCCYIHINSTNSRITLSKAC